jgi:sugar O-acyltransferase (sialic acid O-acetyltransferase NeuD family)
MRIAIIGAAELGKLIAYHAINDSNYTIVGFYDDNNTNLYFNDFPILGNTNNILFDYTQNKFDAVIIAIGYNHMKVRASIFNKLKGEIPFANVIHSSAYLDNSCTLGEGLFILPRVVIDLDVIIEDNVVINTGSIIAHHSKIGAHTFIAPGVHIAGLVNIEQQCFLGIGSIIIDCLNIRYSSIIGAGSLVLKDTEANTLSVGAPAKIIKYLNN